MRTLLIILFTLAASQFLLEEFGPTNPATRVAAAATGGVRWLLHQALHMVE